MQVVSINVKIAMLRKHSTGGIPSRINWDKENDDIFVYRVSELTVEDPVKHSEKIPVFINLTLPNLNCKCKYISCQISRWTFHLL